MIKIRESIFETNSSSCHSCVISDHTTLYETLTPDSTGKLVIEFGEFGWEQETYTDAYTKASYAATLAKMQLESNPELMKMFLDVVFEHTQALEINFNGLKITPEENPLTNTHDYSNGYVDHQSIGDMTSEIFKDEKSLKNFIFNSKSKLETDNDNH